MPRSTAAPFARHQSQRAAKSQRSLASPTDAATTGSTPAAVSCRLSSLPLPISLSVGAPLEALTLLPLFLRAAWLGWMRDAIEDESLTQWHSGCQASVNNSQSGQPGWRGRGEGEDCTAMFSGGTWHDVSCSRISACICEYTIPPPPPMPPPVSPPPPSSPPLPPVRELCSLTCGVSVTWVVVGVLLLLLVVRSYHRRSIARLQSYRHQLQVAMVQSAVMWIPTSPVRRGDDGTSVVSSPTDPESPDSAPWDAARSSAAAAAATVRTARARRTHVVVDGSGRRPAWASPRAEAASSTSRARPDDGLVLLECFIGLVDRRWCGVRVT